MPTLSPDTLPAVQRAIAHAGLDGWLLYEFRGLNPIASQMLGLESFLSRRIFAFVPREGVPVAVTHNIEQRVWRDWPAAWHRERYSAWTTLEQLLQSIVGGKRVAMEYAAGDSVPYLDRVPAGVLEMVRATGATVESSAELVSRFYAVWSDDHLAAHRRAAEHIAVIARESFAFAGAEVKLGRPVTETALQARIADAFTRVGLETYSPPNVSAGANAADPHYEPSPARPRSIIAGDVVLIDLWAREPGGVYADQTWMAVLGPPSDRARTIWAAIRDARDAAIDLLQKRIAAGAPVRGAEVDDAARGVIVSRGLGEWFTHRTGHSIDPRELHGSGPNIDNLETRDDRVLFPGIGFSIEPGLYYPGEIGMRTEVNAYVGEGALVVTPNERQEELIVV